MADILLSELTNVDIDWLAEVGSQRQLANGYQFSITDANHIGNIYLILDGTIAILTSNTPNSSMQPEAKTGEEHVTHLTSGEIIGTAALFDLEVPQVNFQVIEDSIFLEIPLKVLKPKLQNDLGFAANFYRAIDLILSVRVERLIEQPEKLRFSEQHNARDVLNVFSEFRDSDLNWLVNAGKVERYAANNFLLRAGRPTDFLYIILDGAFSVSLPESKMNPLALCFECPVENASTMSVVTTITKGEIAGAIAFLDARPLPVTIRAVRESLVLAIPRSKFNLHIQKDLGFATRFYRILGPQLYTLSMIAMELHGSQPSAQASQGMDADIEYEGELDLDSLQRMTNGANRFNWMLSHLGVGVS